jgi:hypothetical protein
MHGVPWSLDASAALYGLAIAPLSSILIDKDAAPIVSMPIDRDRPAGISSYREAKPEKKTPSGLNVARFIAREEELHQARAYTKAYAATSDRAQWEEKQNLRAGSGARVQQHKQCVFLIHSVFPGFEPALLTLFALYVHSDYWKRWI